MITDFDFWASWRCDLFLQLYPFLPFFTLFLPFAFFDFVSTIFIRYLISATRLCCTFDAGAMVVVGVNRAPVLARWDWKISRVLRTSC